MQLMTSTAKGRLFSTSLSIETPITMLQLPWAENIHGPTAQEATIGQEYYHCCTDYITISFNRLGQVKSNCSYLCLAIIDFE